MKITYSSALKIFINFFASFVFLSAVVSCCKSGTFIYDGGRKIVDSLVRAAAKADSLGILYARFCEDGNTLGAVVSLKEIGKNMRNESRFSEALEAHSKCLSLAESIKDTAEIVQALNNIGTDYRRLGVLESATPYHYRAYKLSEEFSDTSFTARKNMVVSLNGLGNIYMTIGNYDRAEEVLRLALAGEKQLKSAVGQAINYANLGSIYGHKNQLDSAWIYYRRSMELNQQAKNTLGISLCHNYFGSLYEKEGKFANAIEEYNLSRKLMETSKDEWHSLNSLLSLINIYIKTGQFEKVLRELPVAKEIADKIHSKEHNAQICNLYYLLNKKQGNWAKALEYHEIACDLEDNLVDIKKLNQIQNISIAIEREQQERLLDEARLKYQTERSYRIAIFLVFGSVILLLVGLVTMLVYSNRVRRRSINLLNNLSRLRESFFVNVTHELRTPLTIIMGVSRDINKNYDNPDKVHELSSIVERHGKNLLNLINQLLDIAKVKSAHTKPDWRHDDLKMYLSMIVDGYRDYACDRNVNLQFNANESVEMDFVPDYINKIMNNLLSNAFKFTQSGGRITVSLSRSGENAVLSVSDTGVGIPKDKQEYIFEPFSQLEGDSKHLGTGVGLALVKQIVYSVDGNIRVESAAGKGSSFIVNIPLKSGDGKWKALDVEDNIVEPMLPDATEEVLEDVETGEDGKVKLLIIEDNNDVARYIGSQFDGMYDLYYALNGKMGLERARDILPDIIITDLMMPEMDGLELCRQVRRDEIISHIPIIIVTAKVSQADRIKGIEAGADAYLGKPFNSDELKVRVEKLLEQRQALINKFTKAAESGNEAEIQRTDADKRFLCKTVDAIYILMEKKQLDINALSDKLCMSPRQFHRKIQALTGDTPSTYIQQIKMRRAKQLLDTKPNMSIDEISESCGFDHYSSFYHAFKKVYGVTPSQYKKGGNL